ncbi:MAG TPA: ArsA-related P-loop ATPase, partial [Bdellovibrionales bacterium]|nr:ArsA-related P-loop ATPase [Bdellovibrionales bacterium]
MKSQKVIVCAGTGGVGKTTLSAALGVRAASIGLKVLVLTVDPAKRLAAALGLQNLDEEREVPAQAFSGKMFAAMVDQKRILDRFVRDSGLDETIVERILNNNIYKKLSTTLSGSQEFTALERLYESYESGRYDLIILDTPPAAHAVEILDSAQKLSALFQDSIIKWFIRPFEKRGALATLFNRGTNLAFKAFERLTGSAFLQELMDFLSEIYGLRDRLRLRMEAVHALLLRPESSFVLVTAFDASKIGEARRFQRELTERKYQLGDVMINRALPVWDIDGQDLRSGPALNEKLAAYYRQLRDYFSVHEEAFAAFQEDLRAQGLNNVRFLRIPDFDQDVYDLKSLERVAQALVTAG